MYIRTEPEGDEQPITGIMYLLENQQIPDGWMKVDKDLNHNVTLTDNDKTKTMFLAFTRK